MDPLSITASCLAILGAVTASSKGVKKVIDLRHADDEFLELRNEAESLRGLLGLFREALLEIYETSAYRDNRELLSTLLESAHRTVLDLQAFIDYGLTLVHENKDRLSKRRWMKDSSRIEKLKQRIRDARNNLSAAIGALNLRVGGQQSRHIALQIQSIAITQATPSCQHVSSAEQRPRRVLDVDEGSQPEQQLDTEQVNPGRTVAISQTCLRRVS